MKKEIQWHPPFRGAVKIELNEYSDILEYIDEKTLTKKPLFIDLLIVKKRADIKINHPIGNIFKTWNVIEYKSPFDYVSIDDLYKVLAYAYLLKSGADTEDEIKVDQISITFVISKTTETLFNHLEQIRKFQKSIFCKGIYYFLKDGELPIQFICLDELDQKHKWLSGLTNHITKELLEQLVTDYKEEEKNEYKDVVLDTVLKANYELVEQLKKEENHMTKEILELFRPELEEAKLEGRTKGMAEGRTKGMAEGKIEGRVEGRAEEIVNTGYEFGLTEHDIIQRLKKKLNIPEQKAQEYIKIFGK